MTGTRAEAAAADGFERLGPRDNFYQSCSFLPMSFALVTTVYENGETGIGPHALCFPFNVSAPYAMMLISRPTSGTAANIRRTGRCALNYIEFDEERLRSVTRLGYPGQSQEDKRKASPFTLVSSPVPESRADPHFPLIVAEAAQVIQCTWDESMDLAMPRGSTPREETGKFVLRVDDILLRHDFRQGVEQGRRFPELPIFMGFRAGGEFWFARHSTPFPVAAPKVAGMELNSVTYLANRLDETVRFTDEACAMLTGIPRPFLQGALEAIIAAAKAGGVERVDREFVEIFNKNRSSR